MEDHCADCGHNRENYMSFNSRKECDFPDCNCLELNLENRKDTTYDDLLDA
jgi:hypothetical protein